MISYYEITGYAANIDAGAGIFTPDPSNGAWGFNLNNVQVLQAGMPPFTD